jgi:hypothetical protein
MSVSFNKWILVTVFFITTTSFVEHRTFHPFFVSVTEIQHNAKEKTLEISCKIFTDDLEKTLRQNYKTKVDLLNPADKNAMNKLITDYVRNHLIINADDKLLQLQFVGYEKDEEATWSYFQVKNITSIKKINITDNLLFEYKKEQINILHVIVNGKRKSTKFDNPDAKVSLTF